MSDSILRVRDLSRTYKMAEHSLTVLDDVSFDIGAGETMAVVGPSGSGKTTLLGLCAGLDQSTAGSVHLCGKDLGGLNEDARAKLRNLHVGFVFQAFQLVPTLTALENVVVPLELRGGKHVLDHAERLLEQVGLQDRASHYPAQLSGGEQQRVALARAFVNEPDILFADEPTGNLDSHTGELVEDLLFELNESHATTLVLVTHDLELAGRCQRILKLKGGRVVQDEPTAVS